MQLMLTSFGVAHDVRSTAQSTFDSNPAMWSLFYRMMPVGIDRSTGAFTPEYSMLLLCDKVIVDVATFEFLLGEPHPFYALAAATMRALEQEGFVKLVDYSQILAAKKSLLDKMLEIDLKSTAAWWEPFEESLRLWRQSISALTARLQTGRLQDLGSEYPTKTGFDSLAAYHQALVHYGIAEFVGMPTHPYLMLHGFYNTTGAMAWRLKAFREGYFDASDLEGSRMVEPLRIYLDYVNANLVLSNELGVGFHDWVDYRPFYRQKFLSAGREHIRDDQTVEASRHLFEVSFPEFAVQDPAHLLKIMKNRRVDELRVLVQEAAEGKVTFDEAFARSVYREALDTEIRVARYRRLVSYLTVPIGFIPWIGNLAQLALSEGTSLVVEHKLKKQHRWFYMLSEISAE